MNNSEIYLPQQEQLLFSIDSQMSAPKKKSTKGVVGLKSGAVNKYIQNLIWGPGSNNWSQNVVAASATINDSE
jgi:hypothetical protein